MRPGSGHRLPRTLAVIFLLGSLVLMYPAAWAAEGNLKGRVAVTDKNGQVFYADWVRVLLVNAPLDVAPPSGLTDLNRQKQYDRLISAHIGFFKKVQQAMAGSDYLVADTLTRPDGTFGFFDIDPGTYCVVVTFPAMIAGYKVAWQVPVQVPEGQTVFVDLNDRNMLLPTYRRE